MQATTVSDNSFLHFDYVYRPNYQSCSQYSVIQVTVQVPVLESQVPVPVPVPMSQVQVQVPVGLLQFQVPVPVQVLENGT